MSALSRACVAAFAAVWMLASGAVARAAELVLFERKGCIYCARWLAEVGPVYPLTDVGKRAPLRRVDLAVERAPETLTTPVRFTPTFVLMQNDREVGRIVGYMDDATFWGRLNALVARLDQPATP